MPEPSEGTVGEELKTAVGPLSELIEALPEDLARQALTHPSWVENRTVSYERLAFLGDSVLGLAVATSVYETFPKLQVVPYHYLNPVSGKPNTVE